MLHTYLRLLTYKYFDAVRPLVSWDCTNVYLFFLFITFISLILLLSLYISLLIFDFVVIDGTKLTTAIASLPLIGILPAKSKVSEFVWYYRSFHETLYVRIFGSKAEL